MVMMMMMMIQNLTIMMRGKANDGTRLQIQAGHKTIACDDDDDGSYDGDDYIDELDQDEIENFVYFSGHGHHMESWRGERELPLEVLELGTADT